jgi:hypothetical protein
MRLMVRWVYRVDMYTAVPCTTQGHSHRSSRLFISLPDIQLNPALISHHDLNHQQQSSGLYRGDVGKYFPG